MFTNFLMSTHFPHYQVQLQDKIATMNGELEKYSDTSKLKEELDQKRVTLSEEKEQILGTRDASKSNLATLQTKVWDEFQSHRDSKGGCNWHVMTL